NFMAVAAYDGMNSIYRVSNKLASKIDGDKAMARLKGMKITSPRGPLMIDPATRDVVQTVYVKVEQVHGHPYNVEFDQFTQQKDPGKHAKSGQHACPRSNDRPVMPLERQARKSASVTTPAHSGPAPPPAVAPATAGARCHRDRDTSSPRSPPPSHRIGPAPRAPLR
ncbi:MAG: transporter substrate-binding protein, partial [Massilia sp.]|nr:transporter substrate-binding protein [Massilia sp.]